MTDAAWGLSESPGEHSFWSKFRMNDWEFIQEQMALASREVNRQQNLHSGWAAELPPREAARGKPGRAEGWTAPPRTTNTRSNKNKVTEGREVVADPGPSVGRAQNATPGNVNRKYFRPKRFSFT